MRQATGAMDRILGLSVRERWRAGEIELLIERSADQLIFLVKRLTILSPFKITEFKEEEAAPPCEWREEDWDGAGSSLGLGL